MLARESEKLKEFNPLSMPSIQLMLSIDKRQSLVIQMEYKRLGLEVMIAMLQYPNNGIELLIISGVIESLTILLLTKLGKRVLGLSKDRTNPNPTSIRLNFRKELKIG